MKNRRAPALFVVALVLFLHLDSHSSPLLCLPNGLTFPPQGTNSYTCNLFDDGSNPPIVWFPTDWTNHIGDTNWMDGSSNLCCNYYSYVVTGFALPDSELTILSSTNIQDQRSNYSRLEFFTNQVWTYTETDETGYPSGQEKVYACKTLDSHGTGETMGSPGSPDKFIYSPYCMGVGPALALVILCLIIGGLVAYSIYLIIVWANQIVKQRHSQMENACPDGPPDPCTNSVPSRPS